MIPRNKTVSGQAESGPHFGMHRFGAPVQAAYVCRNHPAQGSLNANDGFDLQEQIRATDIALDEK